MSITTFYSQHYNRTQCMYIAKYVLQHFRQLVMKFSDMIAFYTNRLRIGLTQYCRESETLVMSLHLPFEMFNLRNMNNNFFKSSTWEKAFIENQAECKSLCTCCLY